MDKIKDIEKVPFSEMRYLSKSSIEYIKKIDMFLYDGFLNTSKIAIALDVQKIKAFSISHLLNDTRMNSDTWIDMLIKHNANLFKRRTIYNKIILIFDWDKNKSSINILNKLVKEPNKIVHLDIEKRTKLLDKSFRGIEAFLPIENNEKPLCQ